MANRPAVPSKPVQLPPEEMTGRRRAEWWPLKALIFSDAELYRYTLQEFREHFQGEYCEGHAPYRLIWSRGASGHISLNDCAITIEDALDPLDRPVSKGTIWEIAPVLWHDIAAYFDDLVSSGRVVLSGRWNSYGSSLSSVPPDVFPPNLAEALARGDLDIEAGTLRMPNGEVVYSIQFEPPTQHLRYHDAAEDEAKKPAIKPGTALAESNFKRLIKEIISSSPNKVTKTKAEFVTLGKEHGVKERAALRARAGAIRELSEGKFSEQNPTVLEVWTSPGRPPKLRP